MSTSAVGECVPRIAIASAGPTPCVAIEHMERGTLVAAQEPEQRLVVFADVVVHVEEDRRRRLELGQRARRDGDEVADAADLDEHSAVVEALEHRAAQ